MESTTQGSFLLFYTCIISFIPQNDLMRLALLLLFSFTDEKTQAQKNSFTHLFICPCIQHLFWEPVLEGLILEDLGIHKRTTHIVSLLLWVFHSSGKDRKESK